MPFLGVITGLSLGWIAAGVAAAAAPVVAHLLSRRRGPLVDFPAARFVKMALADHEKRRRLRDLVLLAMRVAIVLIIACAFARPVWMSMRPDPALTEGVDVVIVLDSSASMTRGFFGRTIFDAARDQSIELLRSVDPTRDRAALIFAGLAPRAALPTLSRNIDALVKHAGESRATLEHADLNAALALAASIEGADSSAAPSGTRDPASVRPRRIVVVSDMQRSQWAELATNTRAAGVTTLCRGVGPASRTPNLALLGASVTPQRPIAGRPASVSVTVANYSDDAAAPEVTFENGGEAQRLAPTIAPDAVATITFQTVFPVAGGAVAAMRVDDASFPPDDEIRLAVDVAAARRVGVVTASAPDDRSSTAYYITSALHPGDGAEFELIAIPARGLTSEALNAFDAVVIAGAGGMDEASLSALRGWLQSGGGAIWVIDSSDSQQAVERFQAIDPRSTRLPVRFTSPFAAIADPGGASLGRADLEAPAMQAFQGLGDRALVSPIFRTKSPASLSEVGHALISFGSGEPFVAWGPIGIGRLASVHADLAPSASTITKSPIFPALLSELVKFIAPQRAGGELFTVGSPISIALAPGGAPEQPLRDSSGAPVESSGRGSGGAGATLAIPAAAAPGLVEVLDARDHIIARATAVLDPAESDTRIADAEMVLAKVGGGAARERASAVAETRGEAPEPGAIVGRPHAIDLWPALVAAALLLAGVESFVASLRPRRPVRVAVAP